MTAKTYWVTDEGAGFLHERPFRSLDRAKALAAKAAEDCSWSCLTPPAPDNEVSLGRGNFRCGTLAAHGIHIREAEDGRWGEEHDVPQETLKRQKSAGRRVDWTLNIVVDLGTGYLADGEDTLYYTGPEADRDEWAEIAERLADGGELVEWTVQPTPFGRYQHRVADGEYPVKWSATAGFRAE
jgi:hypothetical protein